MMTQREKTAIQIRSEFEVNKKNAHAEIKTIIRQASATGFNLIKAERAMPALNKSHMKKRGRFLKCLINSYGILYIKELLRAYAFDIHDILL